MRLNLQNLPLKTGLAEKQLLSILSDLFLKIRHWSDAIDSDNILADSIGTSELGANAVAMDNIGTFDGVHLTKSSTQSIADSTDVLATWDTEAYDNGGLHSLTSNTSRITIVTPGKYIISAAIDWANDSVGGRMAQIQKNGTGVARQRAAASITSGNSVSYLAHLVAGDYIEINVRQTSGGPLNINTSSECFFSAQWLAQ